MSITKSRLQQIIKEEVSRAAAGLAEAGPSGRGGRYTGGGTTGYRGDAGRGPGYGQERSSGMSDAEARERGGRGYDERSAPHSPRGPRGGTVHSTVSIYVDPAQAADKFNANLGGRLDKAADVLLGMSGYDGMVGNLIMGKDMETGFNTVGPLWVLATAPGGYTFTVEAVVGSGSTPSEALGDAAMQGFEGGDVILNTLGMSAARDGMGTLDESRWNRLAGIL